MLSDLACRLGIDFPARQRGEFVADIHHGVTAFALAVINPKTEAHRASLIPDFGDEAVSFVHLPSRGLQMQESDNFVRMSNDSDKKVRFRDLLSPLTKPYQASYFPNTEFRIPNWMAWHDSVRSVPQPD